MNVFDKLGTYLEKTKLKNWSPAQVIVVGFALVILTGAMLLTLPISSRSGNPTGFVDALLTATSGTCVTGLIVFDTHDYWSLFGQIVIILLIQIGGLGFMTAATMVAFISGKRISLKSRIVLQESLGESYISGVVRLVRYVMLITFSIEAIGALLFSVRFIPEHGLLKGVYYSIFHSISAFCNAGFDLSGGGRSVTGYVSDPLINITIMLLIIIGGIGFTVILDVLRVKTKFSRLTLHSKMVLSVTGALIIFGALFIFLFEFSNSATMGGHSLGTKILASFFHSVSPRTAGFNSLPMDALRVPTVFLTIILMFIGGSPSSTAGGIKTTTFGLVVLMIVTVIRGEDNTVVFKRKFPQDLLNKAVAILAIYLMLLIVATMALSVTDPDKDFLSLLFEITSGLGTVGLTIGITSKLSVAGKLIVTASMFLGRIGPLTLFLALVKLKKKSSRIDYPEGKVMVG